MGKLFLAFLVGLTVVSALFLFRDEQTSLAWPIPQIFGSFAKLAVNNWFPGGFRDLGDDSIKISAKSALLVDYESGKVIFAKNPSVRLPVASTVKIMTALIALERGELADTFVVSQKASKVGENSMGLAEGENLTLSELLYGMMLVSGNDAAVTIAEGIAGSEVKFVELMNEKVKELGLSDTAFINASGLDEYEREQYSSAYDMAVISHYVWDKYPKFREITSTYNKFIEANGYHKAFDLYNDTNLLTTYPGVRGIKPGFTWEAGLCLVTYAERDGKKLLGVILGSDDRRGEMKELLDFGFSQN